MSTYKATDNLIIAWLTNGHFGEDQVKELQDMQQLQRERGQGLVEYGLIIALVAVLAIAGLILFGPAIASLLSNLSTSV